MILNNLKAFEGSGTWSACFQTPFQGLQGLSDMNQQKQASKLC